MPFGSFFEDYAEAYRVAATTARQLAHSVGIERCREYGRAGFRVRLIPNNPAARFGWEQRCEVVEPGAPIV